ncbi:Patatin-like phospholipase [Mucilaginibacter gossypiicola]|uniref:Patatin-like phospholipase n=1 Tax=Mucilaginibacter gossypiicola TaxID=551995 RepID=A0A1H8QL81_9SPHI|nr:patatin-like phospholipase family protein [Mucilaginibacter gossypiicola]SEO54751.1 Patatin-like phospholipase [Mucilaginibacter gossypiicola]
MKNIALAMSGGGYRAAAFSLGALSYLNNTGYDDRTLLQNVTFMSSTSGGSITNIAYSAGLCQGDSFSTIYLRLLNAIDGEKAIKRAFEILNHDAAWQTRPDKSRNLINAFSMAYDELLYPNQYFKLYTDRLGGTHLEEICVNSTEFANGLSFRFQSQHPTLNNGKIGNGYIYFSDLDAAWRLKLSDILASSSCFPGGFEPLIFPEDFTHAGLKPKELNEAINFKNNPFTTDEKPDDIFEDEEFKDNPKRFGLMDGGIADNQAIDSILLASQRRKEKARPPFDLLLITDVTSYLIDSYTLPLEKKSLPGKATINGITWSLFILGLLFPIMILASLFTGWQQWMYLLFIPSLLALVSWLAIQVKLLLTRISANRERSTWSLMLLSYAGYFLKLRLSALIQMLTARLKSVLMITSDIYLKQIRAHYYSQLYADPATHYLVVSNAIYDLSQVKQKAATGIPVVQQKTANPDDEAGELQLDKVAPPSASLVGIAEKARVMATTLWFDKYQRKDNSKAAVVATGQFTTCYNLLKHLYAKQQRVKLQDANQPATQPAETWTTADAQLKTTMETDWKRFNEDPFWLYNQEGISDPGFSPLMAIAEKQRFKVVNK